MSNPIFAPSHPMEPIVYQIRINGQLDAQWREWFGGMSVSPQADGDTLLTGPVTDQAALFGILKKVRDLGVPLVSLIRVQADAAADKPHTGSNGNSQERTSNQ